jgi:hypothetical protein
MREYNSSHPGLSTWASAERMENFYKLGRSIGDKMKSKDGPTAGGSFFSISLKKAKLAQANGS